MVSVTFVRVRVWAHSACRVRLFPYREKRDKGRLSSPVVLPRENSPQFQRLVASGTLRSPPVKFQCFRSPRSGEIRCVKASTAHTWFKCARTETTQVDIIPGYTLSRHRPSATNANSRSHNWKKAARIRVASGNEEPAIRRGSHLYSV